MTKGEPSPSPALPVAQAERGILCAACEHLNRQGETACSVCNEELFMPCPSCGALAQRVLHRCGACHHRLQRPLLRSGGRSQRRWKARLARLGKPLLYATLIGVSLVVAWYVFGMLNRASIQLPE